MFIAALPDLEFIGPFSSWLNVKDALGAKGDGLADDTSAIQRGLDLLRRFDAHTGPAVLYFPAGTYRITRTLQMKLKAGASLVGAEPQTTSIVWDGDDEGTMLVTSGSFDSLFTRLTWDGRGKAAIGIAQWWNFSLDRSNYQGSIKHIDEIYRNISIGIYGGRLGKDYGQGDSETLIERVKFIDNTRAGVNVGSFNALNWWIWDSEFRNCARGVTNDFSISDDGPTAGAGNFAVYRSFFYRSNVADISFGNTGWFSLRANVSIGSTRFLLAHETGANSAVIILQDNRIIDTVDSRAIQVGNEGPLILLNNQFRSLPGATGPVVQMFGSGLSKKNSDRDLFSMGNRFTVAEPIAIAAPGGRLLALDDALTDRDSIDATTPTLPRAAPNFRRKVFEVPVGASADQIQNLIDTAATSDAENAVVHLPAGDYPIDRTLIVPPLARVQIAGDSEATTLRWAGPVPDETMIRLAGPSLATVRDIRLIGAKATAIDVTNADQLGGFAFVEGSLLSSVRTHHLAYTRIEAQANTGMGGLTASSSASVLSIGCGGLGPIRVFGGSNVLVSESWYEGMRADLFRADTSRFTYLGGLMAPHDHGIQAGQSPDTPAIFVDRLTGHASFIGLQLPLRNARNGIEVVDAGEQTAVLFFGVSAGLSERVKSKDFYRATGRGGAVGLVFAKIHTVPNGAIDIPDVGRNDAQFVRDGFRQVQDISWQGNPSIRRPGATDVRLFRIITPDTAVGIDIHG